MIVANASAAGGVAGEHVERARRLLGYTMAEPTDQRLPTTRTLDTSIVYFVTAPPNIQAVAESVARDLGGLTAEPMPTPIPVDGGSIGTATVFVMIGNDIAGESLEDLSANAAPNVQAPAPAGATTTT